MGPDRQLTQSECQEKFAYFMGPKLSSQIMKCENREFSEEIAQSFATR